MLEDKILNSSCKDIYLKIKDKLSNEYNLVLDSSENYIAFDDKYATFHRFWIVLEDNYYKLYYRKLCKLERYNNINSITLNNLDYNELCEVIPDLNNNKQLYDEKIKHFLIDINNIDDKTLFSWFVAESCNNGFECTRDYTFTANRIVFKFCNRNSRFKYYVDYTDKTFLLIYASDNKPIGIRNKNCKIYEISNDNKEEIILLLTKFKDGEIPIEEDGIHKKFKYIYNVIKEKCFNRKDIIEGFYLIFNYEDRKIHLNDIKLNHNSNDDLSTSYYKFKYYSDFCKYDIEIYFNSLTIIDPYNEYYELFFIYKYIKQYVSCLI